MPEGTQTLIPTQSKTAQLLTATPVPTLTRTATTTPTVAPSPTPAPSASPTPDVCRQTEAVFELGQLSTPLLPQLLEFRVYLPPCYGGEPGRRYPVLYLIHGQSSTDEQWERLGAGERASQLITAGEIPPFLIVMPRDRVWSQPTEDNFGKAVADVLIPWIDQRYATMPEREFRAVGGLSRGAGWAVHLGLSQWELFGAIGAHSLPVFWTDTYHIKSWLDAIPPEEMARIYMDIGDKDRPEIMTSAVWFEELLTSRNIAHEWYLFAGYHEEAYWASNMERYLRWYTEGWEQDWP
jgi:enterochelin esterase-like enzyme